MTSQHSVVFAEPVRTAIGTFGGSLKDVSAPTLGSVAIGAAVGRANVRPDEVETVVMGNVGPGGNKMNPARQAAVHGGLPVTLRAIRVNRVCGWVRRPSPVQRRTFASAPQGRRGRRYGEHGPRALSDARGRWGYRMGAAGSMTACCVTDSTTLFQTRIPAGIPRI